MEDIHQLSEYCINGKLLSFCIETAQKKLTNKVIFKYPYSSKLIKSLDGMGTVVQPYYTVMVQSPNLSITYSARFTCNSQYTIKAGTLH